MPAIDASQIGPHLSHNHQVRTVTDAPPAESQDVGMVLSIFPGVGLLDAAFEAEGLSTVRGPDPLWGGDIRRFRGRPGLFWGVMGGPPCQDFSSARRDEPTGYGLEMLAEFRRVVAECRPDWWLLENVSRVPDVRIDGYSWQRIDLDQAWYEPITRLRHVQFGSRNGTMLHIPRGTRRPNLVPGALACDLRPFKVVRRIQGLPDDYDLPGFTREAAVAAVGNGVPLVLGRVLARAILSAYGHTVEPGQVTDWADVESLIRCACGCGRIVRGRKLYDSPACRKRAERARRRVTAAP